MVTEFFLGNKSQRISGTSCCRCALQTEAGAQFCTLVFRVRGWRRLRLLQFLIVTFIACFAVLAGPVARGQTVSTHCKDDERVVFSCPFKHGKTASLCASPDLTNTTGTLQYRYGRIGRRPELIFPNLNERTVEQNHPKNWFSWSSFLFIPLEYKKGFRIETNKAWSTKSVPYGQSVSIYLGFSPINEHPEIDFSIQTEIGPEFNFQGSMLLIGERVGRLGRSIAGYRCVEKKTTENLFFLREILN